VQSALPFLLAQNMIHEDMFHDYSRHNCRSAHHFCTDCDAHKIITVCLALKVTRKKTFEQVE